MPLPPVAPPLASYVGLVVTFLIVTAIGLLARRPELGGLLTTFPAKMPALILALLLADRPASAVGVASAGPLGLAAVAVFAAGVSLGIPRGTRVALVSAFGSWGVFVLLASLYAPRDFGFALGAFAFVWVAALAVAGRGLRRGAATGSAKGADLTLAQAARKALLPAVLVFAALWVQPALGAVLAAALTVLPVNTSSALAQYRGDPGSVRSAMLASVANLVSSLAFLGAFLGLVRVTGTAPVAVAAAVLAAWAAAFVVTLLVKAALANATRAALRPHA